MTSRSLAVALVIGLMASTALPQTPIRVPLNPQALTPDPQHQRAGRLVGFAVIDSERWLIVHRFRKERSGKSRFFIQPVIITTGGNVRLKGPAIPFTGDAADLAVHVRDPYANDHAFWLVSARARRAVALRSDLSVALARRLPLAVVFGSAMITVDGERHLGIWGHRNDSDANVWRRAPFLWWVTAKDGSLKAADGVTWTPPKGPPGRWVPIRGRLKAPTALWIQPRRESPRALRLLWIQFKPDGTRTVPVRVRWQTTDGAEIRMPDSRTLMMGEACQPEHLRGWSIPDGIFFMMTGTCPTGELTFQTFAVGLQISANGEAQWVDLARLTAAMEQDDMIFLQDILGIANRRLVIGAVTVPRQRPARHTMRPILYLLPFPP